MKVYESLILSLFSSSTLPPNMLGIFRIPIFLLFCTLLHLLPFMFPLQWYLKLTSLQRTNVKSLLLGASSLWWSLHYQIFILLFSHPTCFSVPFNFSLLWWKVIDLKHFTLVFLSTVGAWSPGISNMFCS